MLRYTIFHTDTSLVVMIFCSYDTHITLPIHPHQWTYHFSEIEFTRHIQTPHSLLVLKSISSTTRPTTELTVHVTLHLLYCIFVIHMLLLSPLVTSNLRFGTRELAWARALAGRDRDRDSVTILCSDISKPVFLRNGKVLARRSYGQTGINKGLLWQNDKPPAGPSPFKRLLSSYFPNLYRDLF